MAFLQPPASQQPAFNVPTSVVLLLVLLIGVHGALALLPAATADSIVAQYAFNPALYSSAFLDTHHIDGGAWWQRAIPFVSYIFLHADLMHLAINCLWLLAFGPVVARRFGGLRFLIFFLICGICAAAFQMVCSWGSFAPIIGASGAVSGLMAAGIRMLPLQDNRISARFEKLMPIWSRQVLLFSIVWTLINVVAGITGFAGVGTELRLIAWQAHIGGYVAGLFLSTLFDRRNEHAAA
ncbi:MAG TPA: rhomboid family intramembrane serine protease [Rhizomicrobium sp.]|jgi:membrane associated rhomboid family serine protease|nr:rhomboid family intramembrane serine protease [Rhizomicrobium sp.]